MLQINGLQKLGKQMPKGYVLQILNSHDFGFNFEFLQILKLLYFIWNNFPNFCFEKSYTFCTITGC